jgi:2-polyprenyl-3-methyl-5-hydroxy-6-metoxy-1,4-benzoquinol methylase
MRKKDAFGLALWDYLKDKDAFEIIERSDGYIGGIIASEYFTKYKEWPSYVKKALKFVKGRVLDVGCGAGRHALHLQRKGFNVTGIDSSPLAIKVCKKQGLKKAKIMRISSIHNFKPNSFDTIIMLGHNFGLFGTPKKAKTLLKKMHKITTPNALIIADTRNPVKSKNPEHKKYQRMNKRKGRLPGQVRMRVLYKNYRSDWFNYLFVSKKEMRNILKGTGWKVNKFIDSKVNDSYTALIEKIYKN